MSRALAALLALAVLTVVAAGCGSSGSSGGPNNSGGSNNNSGSAVYTAKGTVECLRTKGFKHVTTAREKIGFIAGFANNGGLKAQARSGNIVTIAFTQGADGVPGTERAFKHFAKGIYKRHIRDVMRAQGNAVLVWTKTPRDTELNDVLGCLHS